MKRNLGMESKPLVVLAITAIVYLTTVLVILPRECFWSPDAGMKLIQLQNFRYADGFDYSITYPGQNLDPTFEYVPFRKAFFAIKDGKVFLQWPIFFPLLSAPFSHLFGFFGLYIVPLLSTILTLYVVYLLSIPMAGKFSWLSIPLAGLCTPLFVYGLLFWEHAPAAFLTVLSAWLMTKGMNAHKARWFFLSGVVLGASVYLRSEMYIFIGSVLLAYVVVLPRQRWRCLLKEMPVFIGGLVMVLLPLWLFYGLAEGRPLPAHALSPVLPFSYASNAKWNILADLIVGPETDLGFSANPLIKNGFVAAAANFAVCGLFPSSRRKDVIMIISLVFIILISFLTLFSKEPYRAIHGFLAVCPFIIFGFFNLVPAAGNTDRSPTFVGTLAIVYFILHSSVMILLRDKGPIGGLEWGPRYMLPIYPLLTIVSLSSLLARLQSGTREVFGRLFVMCFLILTLCSLGYQIRGTSVIYQDKSRHAYWVSLLQSIPDTYIVTDLWWFPVSVASEFYNRKMFVVENVEQLNEWLSKAIQHNVNSFCFVSQANVDKMVAGASLSNGKNVCAREILRGSGLTFTRLQLCADSIGE